MLEKLKSMMALVSGWVIALGIAVFYLLSRKSPTLVPIPIQPKKVPTDPDKRDEELRKRGLIK